MIHALWQSGCTNFYLRIVTTCKAVIVVSFFSLKKYENLMNDLLLSQTFSVT